LAPRLKKKGYHGIWEASLQPLGPMFHHLCRKMVMVNEIAGFGGLNLLA